MCRVSIAESILDGVIGVCSLTAAWDVRCTALLYLYTYLYPMTRPDMRTIDWKVFTLFIMVFTSIFVEKRGSPSMLISNMSRQTSYWQLHFSCKFV